MPHSVYCFTKGAFQSFMIDLIEEKIILRNLITTSDYYIKVIPYIEEKYFTEVYTKQLFQVIKKYSEVYNKQPTIQVLELFLGKVKGVNSADFDKINDCVEFIKSNTDVQNCDWLVDETVKWIRARQYFDAIMDAATEYEKGDLDGELPSKIDNALGFDIDNNIGLDFDDVDEKWSRYTDVAVKIPCNLDIFNEIMNGGVRRKTLNLFMSSKTGGGKTLSKCHMAASYLMQGYNVLYITLEIAESEISQRIDANILDIEMDKIATLGEAVYKSKIDTIKQKTRGKLKVKEYPATTCSAATIRKLLDDYKRKCNFVPDILFVDYLGIMVSHRFKNQKRYEMIQAVAEELHGLAKEQDIAIWSSTQSNRGGASDPEELDMDDVSESYGMLFAVDFLIAIISTPEFAAQNKYLFKQLKNRYAPIEKYEKFFLGVEKAKMKLFDMSTPGKYASDADFNKTYANPLPQNKQGLDSSKKKKLADLQ